MNLTVTNLSLFETSKQERQIFAEQITNSLLEGLTDPLKVHLQVKCMEDFIKQITSNSVYKDLIVTEAIKYGKTFEHHNAKFEIKEAGVKYDFQNCNDPILKELEDKFSILDTEVKERQKFLKSIKESVEVLIGDEIVTLYPPVKTSTTSVTVNLK
jgi:hypothetical protein